MKKKDLTKLIYSATNKQLLKYLQEEYSFYLGKDKGYFKNRLNELKQLDIDTIKFGIARMEEIQEERNIMSSLPSLVTLMTALIASYISVLDKGFEVNNLKISSALNTVAILIVTITVIYSVTGARLGRSKAALFKELLLHCEKLKTQNKK
ncbi:hypothetical protein JYA63_14520 [Fictibacillus nanhaiensis]|uniref:Uncharacterized protein n=1 Tax=Fictibacillus nanhaiensis TaxID=742169 RepID=A0ABS2ZTX9_9BACL|nr:hypothetical protein [Fictibacillus nanhaiensis]